MSDPDSAFPVPAGQRLAALSRWENEGGALAQTNPEGLASLGDPALSNTELVQLRIRVVALENLLLALLAEGTGRRHRHVHRHGRGQARGRRHVDARRPRPGR